MAEYEDLVELGIEGIDRFATKYHDQVYDHLPAWRHKQVKQAQQAKKHQQDQHQASQQGQQQPPQDQKQSASAAYYADRGLPPDVADEGAAHRGRADSATHGYDRGMSSDRGYTAYESYRGGDARGHEEGYYGRRGSREGYDGGYAVARGRSSSRSRDLDYDNYRGRPEPRRMRSSSYSPPRSHRNHSRHRSSSRRDRSHSHSRDKQKRLAAMVGGAIVGGFAGNRVGKGKGHDQLATIVGAIVGGVGAREATEHWEHKRRRREEEERDWEEEFNGGPETGARRGSRGQRY